MGRKLPNTSPKKVLDKTLLLWFYCIGEFADDYNPDRLNIYGSFEEIVQDYSAGLFSYLLTFSARPRDIHNLPI